ncbi:P-loop containing nucleoside triphosphate hydrolase protein [Flagelloscypha sp. PMI_526]|nr:P-loop containing nucleoside triphosphate hydrolase protein [Flagelloscypha sp. PMI_526]
MSTFIPHEDLVALGKAQLGHSGDAPDSVVPVYYLREICKHLALSHDETNFRITLQPGYGYGVVYCLEENCTEPIPLIPCVNVPDGGRSEGLGSLAAYRDHTRTHTPHASSRFRRLLRTGSHTPQVEVMSDHLTMQVPSTIIPQKRPPPEDPPSLFQPSSPKRLKRESSIPLTTSRRMNSLSGGAGPRSSYGSFQQPHAFHFDQNDDFSSTSRPSASTNFGFVPFEPEYSTSQLPNPPFTVYPDPSMTYNTFNTEFQDEIPTPEPLFSGGSIPPRPSRYFEPSADPVYPDPATDEEIMKFIHAAGNQESFDSSASVQQGLEKLGLESVSKVMDGMRYPFFPHQVIGVAWMLDKETSKNRDVGYLGGILADDMGLGKTVQTIGLIVKNPPLPAKHKNARKTTLIIGPKALLDQWDREIESKCTRNLKTLVYHGAGKVKRAADLNNYDVVITSHGVVREEWAPDAEERDRMEKLEERKRKKAARDGTEDQMKLKPIKKGGVCFLVRLYISIHPEYQSQDFCSKFIGIAVADLNSLYRWCLTGTPIYNRLQDAYPYLRFLQIRPWCDWLKFKSQVVNHEKRRTSLASKRLQTILAPVLLRRLKDSMLEGKKLIELPPKEVEFISLEFDEDERQLYDQVEKKMQIKFNRFVRDDTVMKNYSVILVMLLRLRQLCTHPWLICEKVTSSTKSTTPKGHSELSRARAAKGESFIQRVQAKLQALNSPVFEDAMDVDGSDEIGETCGICEEPFTEPVITSCEHAFCKGCLDNVLETSSLCPSCHHDIPFGHVFDLTAFESFKGTLQIADAFDSTNVASLTAEDFGEFEPSTKMKWMTNYVRELRRDRPDEKVIVISQWTSCLELVSQDLCNDRISHVRYQGDMDRGHRDAAVQKFMEENSEMVMLLSQKCGGVGLNLNRANHVVSLDLAWNPATENQAFDRAHRFGQTRPVMVNRLVIANTVEDRILQLQAKKQNLANASLGDGGVKRAGRMSVRQLAELFGVARTRY